jgi:hypothetical protein
MDLSTRKGRRKLIDHIESQENLGRKASSYRASEILNDRLKPYVIEELREQFDESSIKEIPVVSSINIAKRVVNALACIYREAPVREFPELTEEQAEQVKSLYDDMGLNKKLNLANKCFKNHDQCLVQIVPKRGKLYPRVLKPHQWDIIPSMDDPEEAAGYIISAYDNYSELLEAAEEPRSATGQSTLHDTNERNYKQKKASDKTTDKDKIYLVWTMEENYFMNQDGDIVGEVMPNPLAEFGMMPFVEIHTEKEFEYWVRAQNTFADFTIDFCVNMSSVSQVVRMQGFAQAILKGHPEMMPESLMMGPTKCLKLPVDPQAGVDTDFEFAQPGSDIAGSIQFLEVLLAAFLSSNGIDPKTVSLKGESQQFNSGLERMLAMIEKVSASREDYDTFEKIEYKIWNLIKAWLLVLNNTDTLDEKYQIGSFDFDTPMTIEFAAPEMVKSDKEELDIIQQEIDLGISSPVRAIMQREQVTREVALEIYQQYQEDLIRRSPVGVEG